MADRQEVEQDVVFRSHGSGDYTYEPETDDVQVTVTLKTGLYQEFDGAQKLRVNIQVVNDEDDQGNADDDTADKQTTSNDKHDTAGKEAHKDTEQKHQPTQGKAKAEAESKTTTRSKS